MCEVKSEVRGEGELKVLQTQEIKVLQKHEQEHGNTDPAETSNVCCVPFCPEACG